MTEKERQLWEYVLSAYGTEEFTTKRLEKDFGNAAYATIRAFVMKFASMGLLKARKAGNKVLDITTLIISKKPGNTGISRDIRTEFTTDLLLSD